MSIATPTATQARTQASPLAPAAVRWYQLAVIVLGLALAAVTALAVYFAVTNPTATVDPPSNPGLGHTQTVDDHPCYQPQVPC